MDSDKEKKEESKEDAGGGGRKCRASCRGKVEPPDRSDPDPEAKKRRISSPPEFFDDRDAIATVPKPPDHRENSKVRSPLFAYSIK